MSSSYTAAEKLEEAERECGMRIRHYPTLVTKGSLSQELAQRRIKLMKAIADDYRQLAQQELLPA